MALAALRQWALRSPWAGLLAPKGKGRQGEQGGTTWDEDVQATLAALVTRAEGRPPEDPRAKRAMCFSTALEMKFSGNSSFKKGAYADAASAYERGLDALEILTQIGVDAEEDEAVGPKGTRAVVVSEARRLQATLLSNRAEAFLRIKPPRLAEAAASARAALHIDPTNEKAQRRLERADPNFRPAQATPQNSGRLRGDKHRGTVTPAGGWRGVLVQAAKRSGAQAIGMLILLGVMAIIQAVPSPFPFPFSSPLIPRVLYWWMN